VPAAAHGQTAATKPAVAHGQVLSTNPLGEIAQWFNVEYERKIGLATTPGGAASTFKYEDYTSASLLLRWYPQGAALDGFYLGARTGAYGFGVTRLFGSRANGYDAPEFMPNIRLANVGIAF
jgi:hypothetical protein